MYSIKSNNKKWNNIMKDYYNEITLCFTEEKTPFCRYELKNIYFQYDVYMNPNEEDLFDLLHEIGHIVTNNTKMKRCEEEYYATQWAIDNMNKYDVVVNKKFLNGFQEYIWKWRDRGIKCGAKNIPSKKQLKLKY